LSTRPPADPPPPSPESPRAGGLPAELSAPIPRIDARLARIVDRASFPTPLAEAIRYALLSPGKRVRPLLAWHCCAAVGADPERSLPAGAAVELVHAFSLVHDDLPALDNDDLRRGRPTLHKHAGEAMAILAGDAMLTLAFAVLADEPAEVRDSSRLSAELARATTGMIAGQVWDTMGGLPPGAGPAERVRLVHAHKTGALIVAACRMGALCGSADPAQLAGLTVFAGALGLMFQAVDDVLDVTQPSEHLGKRSGKDSPAGKLTYPAVFGLEGARAEVSRLEAEALAALGPLGPHARPLDALVSALARRSS